MNINSYWFEIIINIQFIFSLFISNTAISSNMQKLTRKKKMYDIIQVPNSVNLTAAHLYSIKALKFLFHKKINEWCRKVITTSIFVTKYLWKYWAWILNFIDIHVRWNSRFFFISPKCWIIRVHMFIYSNELYVFQYCTSLIRKLDTLVHLY